MASAAAGLQMMMGAVDSLSTAIADGSAGFSDYLSAIVSVGFAIPMLINGIKGISAALKLQSVWEKIVITLKKVKMATDKKEANEAMANAAKKAAALLKEKISAIGTAIAHWAKLLVQWPAGTIAALAMLAPLALAGAAIGGVAISASNKQEDKQKEEKDNKAIETAENALEVAEGWSEESKAMDDLIAKHN